MHLYFPPLAKRGLGGVELRHKIMTVIFNKKTSINARRRLRKQKISAEKDLWNKLRRDRLGFRFRRQYGIGNYIVDFYCPKLKLIIEVDGATHSTDEEISNDRIRENYFKKLGLAVKRYFNSDIYNNLDLVTDNIYEICLELSGRKSSYTPPQPSSSQEEGEMHPSQQTIPTNPMTKNKTDPS